MKRILIIDGQGGGMGAQLAKLLLPKLPADCELLAVGTNVLATSAMLKAGAVRGATGENAVVYNATRADVILGHRYFDGQRHHGRGFAQNVGGNFRQ